MRKLRRNGGIAAFLLFGFASSIFSGSASGQNLDPGVLQNLQRQLGSPQQTIARQPQVDSDSVRQGEPAAGLMGGQVDTVEEQELRRAQARRSLTDLYQPSAIEQDYRRRTGDKDLRQFGYDFLQSARPPSGTRSGAIGDDYVLGIGDEIQVSMRGASNSSYTTVVDRDGRVVVGDLRPIQAAGRSLGAVRAEISAETKRTLLATEAFVSVGDVRSISVFVGGEVERPGQINLNSMSDIGTAISMAGGVRRSGSLRQVRLVRAGGGTVLVDLYGLFGIGSPPAVRLRDGDRIIVPVIGPTVAVTGAVARPGIYEIRGDSSAASVIAFAGGAIRQRGAQVVISRIRSDGSEVFQRAAAAGSTIMAGDAVQVIGGSAGGAHGRVELLGNVANVGPRPLLAASTVSDLVGRSEDLPTDTYEAAALLQRREPMTGAREYVVFNLAEALRGAASMPLQSEDRVYIFSRNDIRFLNSVAVRQIILGGKNSMPQCRSLEALEALVKDTDSNRFNAVTRGNFVVMTQQGAQLGSVGGAGQSGSRIAMENGASRTREADEDNAECPAVFENVPELLPVLLEHSISVGGSVRRPGAYPVGGRVSAANIALLAEGLVAGASNVVLDINRANNGMTERLATDDTGSIMALTMLAPGDDVRFNALQPTFEASAILLTGEVAKPGLYSIRKGERLSELLSRAGGLTSYAYPYGTVFSRVSVKEAQQEGFRRTARELNNSLLAVAARSQQGSAEGIAGAAALVSTLAQAEASGRVVVEADPRVLELRPDLDTILEPGDRIFIPKQPNFVIALGDVNNPGALQFVRGKAVGTYLAEAGGTLSTADGKRAFVVFPDGTARPIRGGGWGGSQSLILPPGTTIIVPKNIDPLFRLSMIRDITAIIAQLATSVATVAVLASN